MKDETIEPEFNLELPSDLEAIEAACNAYRIADEIDLTLAKHDEKQINRIKKNALFIIDKALQYIREPYETE